ncbi:MAG: hypothetical protein ACI814_002066, partial [Mariniblastus sp.]
MTRTQRENPTTFLELEPITMDKTGVGIVGLGT